MLLSWLGSAVVALFTAAFLPSANAMIFSDVTLVKSATFREDAVKANYGEYYVCFTEFRRATSFGKCLPKEDGTTEFWFTYGRRSYDNVEDWDFLVYGDLVDNGYQYIWVKHQDWKAEKVVCDAVMVDGHGAVNVLNAEEEGDYTLGTWKLDGGAWISWDGRSKNVGNQLSDSYILCAVNKFYTEVRFQTGYLGGPFPEQSVAANEGMFAVCYSCQLGDNIWGGCEAQGGRTFASFPLNGAERVLMEFKFLLPPNEPYSYSWVKLPVWKAGYAQCQAVIQGQFGIINVPYARQRGGWLVGKWSWTKSKAWVAMSGSEIEVTNLMKESYILCATNSRGSALAELGATVDVDSLLKAQNEDWVHKGEGRASTINDLLKGNRVGECAGESYKRIHRYMRPQEVA
ncbi:hypothetical protein BSKO_13649 [Bryopsis sp. KO-2023]|nr:hypothetical protein BSKO_13649 [Bryopsis sp. KO-2023]